jgi:signal transduction histidine kinase
MRVRDRRRLEMLAYEVTVAEARERERIANDIHDGLGQLLAIARMRLDELDQSLTGSASSEPIAALRSLLAEAGAAARLTTFELHSPLLAEHGLQAAIEGLGARVARHGDTQIVVDGRISPLGIPHEVQAILLRVVRELLLNVHKHARAHRVTITLGGTERSLQIRVADDGRGFDVQRLPGTFNAKGGFGLPSAEAQMRAVGGRLELRSERDRGTTATVSLPLAHCRPHQPAPGGALPRYA